MKTSTNVGKTVKMYNPWNVSILQDGWVPVSFCTAIAVLLCACRGRLPSSSPLCPPLAPARRALPRRIKSHSSVWEVTLLSFLLSVFLPVSLSSELPPSLQGEHRLLSMWDIFSTHPIVPPIHSSHTLPFTHTKETHKHSVCMHKLSHIYRSLISSLCSALCHFYYFFEFLSQFDKAHCFPAA